MLAIAVTLALFATQSVAVRDDQDVHPRKRDLAADLTGRTVRLQGGNSTYGRVEVFHDGVWGTVCDDQFDVDDGKVVCRQLGLSGVVQVYHQATFGEGTGPIWLDNVDCKGDELRIESCGHNGWNVTDCKHEEDAGVACQDSPTELQLLELMNEQAFHIIQQSKFIKQRQQTIDQLQQTLESLRNAVQPVQLYDNIQQTEIGQLSQEFDGNMLQLSDLKEVSTVSIRLAGADSNELQGRVEVFYDGQWGTICDDSWGIEEANVVCRQLGFPQAKEATTSASSRDAGNGTIWLDDVNCLGNETSLSQCAHRDWGDHNCKHEEDAGVVCYDWKAGFSASLSSRIGTSETDIIFNVIDANIGDHYDQTTGTFRAPLDGYYMFFFNGYSYSTNEMYIDLMINDSVYKDQWVYDNGSGRDSYDAASNSIILRLNMGDEVKLRLHSGYYLNGGVQTSFSGFLLSAV
ncbi:scavenger receptor cysteine-rich type 1 protein M130-like [Branchiostoma floridae]|uniref:Scavenger receptor cysteine-rich type 1 protein M130-like n=1 Tax=Branchiostoma floridae TaxID=7739 RepID=A0A9J7N7C7_BRAFL|nr:scavenger receptor cysteine-rich type 1 protein M130-like [Branchiostoma floridae]